MSRTHHRSNTLILWFCLSAAACASALGIGCSASSDPGAGATADKGGSNSGGATTHAGSHDGSSEAGESALGGETGESGDAAGSENAPVKGVGGSGSVAGGSNRGGAAGDPGEPLEPGEPEDPGEPNEPANPAAGGSGGAPAVEDPAVSAARARAVALIEGLGKLRKCSACHDTDYKGSGFFPNITPDMTTGIGSWSDEQIKTAIRDGKDDTGTALCATMERYAFSDEQLADLVVYLRHLPPVSKKITAKCPSF